MDLVKIEKLISRLSDLELAILLSLIAQNHCLIETTDDCIDDVSKELALICQSIFRLSYALVNCTQETSLDDFNNAILVPDPRQTNPYHSPLLTRHVIDSDSPSLREHSISPIRDNYLDDRKVVNVIIAKNFHFTRDDIQIQALELLRSRRLFTKSAVHSTPKTFLFVPVIALDATSIKNPLLNRHLNDHIFLSHFHEAHTGYPSLEDDDSWVSDDQKSLSSVVRKSAPSVRSYGKHEIDEEVISRLRSASHEIFVSADIAGYLQNIVVFLRLHRAVAGGISARATNHFLMLAKYLTPLHGIKYLTPSIVALAAKKVYRHRIIVATADNDRSLQYGSDREIVSHLLKDVNPEAIIDNVVEVVEAPL